LKAIILATAEKPKLTPLSRKRPVPMLSVANRPVMSYTIELLARHGIKNILVSVYHLAEEIEAYFGTGKRWGVNLNYVLQRDSLGSAGALRWAKSLLDEKFLVIPGDILCDFDISSAIQYHITNSSTATVIVQKNQERQNSRSNGRIDTLSDNIVSDSWDGQSLPGTGIYLFEPCILDMIPANTKFDIEHDLNQALHGAGLHFLEYQMDGYWNSLCSYLKYQEAQTTLISQNGAEPSIKENRTPYIKVSGRQISDGIWLGRQSQIHPSVKLEPPLYIGEYFKAGKGVELGPNVIIGSNVMVDDDATIKNSSIMDQTYIGQLVKIENRIVDGTLLIDVNTEKFIDLKDEFLLARMSPTLEDKGLWRFVEIIFVITILILTLPILLILGFFLYLKTGHVFKSIMRISPLEDGHDISNNVPFQIFPQLRFVTCHTDGRKFKVGNWIEKWELARLPELLNVLKGNMALIGVKPLTPDELANISEQWQEVKLGSRPGFSGLWYTQTDYHSSADEMLLADAYYAVTRIWREDMKILFKTPAAWLKRIRFARY